MSEPRTFAVTSPAMHGHDVEDWQRHVRWRFREWGIRYPLEADGVYGVTTRAATATLLAAFGVAQSELRAGVSPALRTKIRGRHFSPAERARFAARVGYRRRLRAKFAVEGNGVCSPLVKIITHANGYSSWHDGVDLICPPEAHGYAICRSKVVRVSDSWWGLGSPGGALADKGDGIVILQSLVSLGRKIRRGDYFGYGHAEYPRVKVGDTVDAGAWICAAGLANAWHFHFMHFRGDPGVAGDGGPKGVGNRDPWPAVKYAIEHA